MVYIRKRSLLPAAFMMCWLGPLAGARADEMPFQARFQITRSSANALCPAQGFIVEGEGEAPHLGPATTSIGLCQTSGGQAFGTVGGSFTITGAGGGTIFGDYSGTIIRSNNTVIRGDFVITGGTGTFVGATGSGVLNLAFTLLGGTRTAFFNGTIQIASPACATVPFLSPDFFLLSLHSPPREPVVIRGTNFNAGTTDLSKIRLALGGSVLSGLRGLPLPAPQRLNQRLVAAQLSLIRAGGFASPPATAVLNSPLSCYGFNPADPVMLSNGSTLTPATRLADLFGQAGHVIDQGHGDDAALLAGIFEFLGSDSLFPGFGSGGGTAGGVTIPCCCGSGEGRRCTYANCPRAMSACDCAARAPVITCF